MAGRAKTAAWRCVGSYVVCAHSASPPSEMEWEQILATFRNLPEIHKVRVLVYTLGGAPDARQRARLSQLLSSIKPPVAVLTPSALARAAGVAISWFIPTLKIFEPEAIDRALDHLDAPQADRLALNRTLTELRKEVGG